MKKAMFFVFLWVVIVGSMHGVDLIDENIQNWTTNINVGDYTQTIAAGTVNLTQCRVVPTASANGSGSAGCFQLYNSLSIVEFPQLSSIGTIELVFGSSPARAAFLQINKGSGWVNVE